MAPVMKVKTHATRPAGEGGGGRAAWWQPRRGAQAVRAGEEAVVAVGVFKKQHGFVGAHPGTVETVGEVFGHDLGAGGEGNGLVVRDGRRR